MRPPMWGWGCRTSASLSDCPGAFPRWALRRPVYAPQKVRVWPTTAMDSDECLAPALGRGWFRGTWQMLWSSLLDEVLLAWTIPLRRSMGDWSFCTRCNATGYLRKSDSAWQPCPDCSVGRCWTSGSHIPRRIGDSGRSRKQAHRWTLGPASAEASQWLPFQRGWSALLVRFGVKSGCLIARRRSPLCRQERTVLIALAKTWRMISD